MSKQTIFTGTVANDGTGDGLRTSFGKVNDNFNEIYDYTSNFSRLVDIGSNNSVVLSESGQLTWYTSDATNILTIGNGMGPLILANASLFTVSVQDTDNYFGYQGSVSYPGTYQTFVYQDAPNNEYSYAVTLDGNLGTYTSDVTIISKKDIIANNNLTVGDNLHVVKDITLGSKIKFTEKGNIYDELSRPILNLNALDINADGGTSRAVFAVSDISFDGGFGESVFGAYESALDGGVSFNNKHSASLIDGGSAVVF